MLNKKSLVQNQDPESFASMSVPGSTYHVLCSIIVHEGAER